MAEGEKNQMESVTKPKRRFGVGCAQFAPKDVNRRFRNFDEYVKELEKSLGTIAAFQHVEIKSSDGFGNFDEELPVPFLRLSDDEFPFLAGMSGVKLDIMIYIMVPTRTQKELLDITEDASWTPFDKIRIFISHNYLLPIMIIFSDDDPHNDASECVVMVRRFLKNEMDKNNNCDFMLDIVGPTPFHADFIVYEKLDIHKYTFELVERRGYDEIRFFTEPEAQSARSIEGLLLTELTSDLDLFYQIILERNNVMKEWHSCFEKVRQFDKERSEWKIHRRILSVIVPPFKVYESVSDLTTFRLNYISSIAEIKDRISEKRLVEDGPIWLFIKKEIKTFPKYDAESLEKLIEYIDRRQARHQVIIYTLIAAIVGGIVGGLAGVLVRLWISIPGAGGN